MFRIKVQRKTYQIQTNIKLILTTDDLHLGKINNEIFI